jgi:branched-chain amino acid transport system ATP-binding protein
LLRVEGLTAGYTQLPVIQDLSLECRPGSIVTILGPNGSGKSTLLKTAVGLLKPMAGSVRVGDTDITGWKPFKVARSGVGYVPQMSNVFVSLTVLENLEMGAFSIRGDVRERIREVLDAFPDLADAIGKKAGQLSGGQRNLLGVARALMLRPQVILVDEPTAGLAPNNTKRIWDGLSQIAKGGTAVVVAEQNVDVALAHADRAYVLVAGRTKLEGPAAAAREADLHAMFLGQEPSAVRPAVEQWR